MSPFIDYATCNFKVKNPIKGIIQYEARKHHVELADLYDNNRFVLVKKYRQGGFTVMTALWALHECITKPNKNILFVIGQDREALDVKESIIDLALGLMPNKPDFLKSNNHELKLANGSHLTFFTPMACCGKRADNIIIDEAAFIKDLDCHYKALWPCVQDNGKIFLVSSISHPDGLFYETYKKALAWENNFKVYAPDCREVHSKEELKNIRESLGEKNFRSEYMAKYPGEL
jgi:hypothetical protein